MRSRYSAYVLKLADYLLATWHPRTRPPALQLDDAAGAATRWLGLDVREHRVIDAQHAEVEFVARYRSVAAVRCAWSSAVDSSSTGGGSMWMGMLRAERRTGRHASPAHTSPPVRGRKSAIPWERLQPRPLLSSHRDSKEEDRG